MFVLMTVFSFSDYHSTKGPIGVSTAMPPHKLTKYIFQAVDELGIPKGDCSEPNLLGNVVLIIKMNLSVLSWCAAVITTSTQFSFQVQ